MEMGIVSLYLPWMLCSSRRGRRRQPASPVSWGCRGCLSSSAGWRASRPAGDGVTTTNPSA